MMNPSVTPSTALPAGTAVARQATANERPSRWPSILAGAGLALMVLVAYAPLWNASYIWDDDAYVTSNVTLRSPAGLTRIWFELGAVPQYYPLVHTTFWIEYRLWNLEPLGFHVTNVALHATCAILLWRLLTRLNVPGAWLAAALFAVHPVEVETVAWITERKNVLSLALALVSLLCYLRFEPPTSVASDAPQSAARWAWYAAAFLCFVGAMLSKTVVASLPAVLLVIYWWRRGNVSWRDALLLGPFFFVGVRLGMLTVWMEKSHVGAVGEVYDLSFVERLLIAGRALWFYAATLVWPYPLAFFYPRWAIHSHAWWQYLYPAGAVSVIVALFLARHRIGRGPLAAVLIFAGVLFPALGFFNVYPFRFSYVADHFQYHASVALLALFAASAATWTSRMQSRQPALVIGAAAIPLVVLTALTFARTQVFYNSETLFRDTIAKNPESSAAYANLAGYLDSQGRYAESLQLARDALARISTTAREDDPTTRGNLAMAHNNVAACLLRLGNAEGLKPAQVEEVQFELREAIKLDPKLTNAYCNLASMLLGSNRPDEALNEVNRALDVDPRNAEAWYVKGIALEALGQSSEAEASYVKALEVNPDFALAHHKLGLLLVKLRRPDQAAAHFEAARRLNPRLTETP